MAEARDKCVWLTACLPPPPVSARLAPLPPKKVTVVEETMATGLEFLAQSK